MNKKYIIFFLTLPLSCSASDLQNYKTKVIKCKYLTLNDENIKNFTQLWKSVTQSDKLSLIVFDKQNNQIILRGKKSSLNEFKNTILHADIKPPRVRLDFIILLAENDFNFNYGINWSGIYNRLSTVQTQNKNFDFVGLGGSLAKTIDNNGNLVSEVDIPTPTQPFDSSNPNLLVDPTNYAINIFSGLIGLLAPSGDITLPGVLGTGQTTFFPIVFGGPDLNTRRLNAIINATELEKGFQVISRPTVLTNANEPIKLIVGQSLPYYVAIAATTPTSNTNLSALSFQNVGVSINSNTRIVDKNKITLDLTVEFTDQISGNTGVSPLTGLNPNPPTFENIIVKTKITTINGHTTIIGGYDHDSSTTITNSIPWLRTIPLVGKLIFQAQGLQNIKLKKFVLLTASILND